MTNISDNGIITICAGDYFKAPLFINAGDDVNPLRYTLNANDKVYFSIVEPNQPFECGVVRKTFTQSNVNPYGDVIIELSSSDTERLLRGRYYYEVKLLIKRNNVDYIETIVPRRKFNIV